MYRPGPGQSGEQQSKGALPVYEYNEMERKRADEKVFSEKLEQGLSYHSAGGFFACGGLRYFYWK